MTLYREGTLLRDYLGALWMITGYCRFVQPNAKRLADSFTSHAAYRIVHREMKLVSEA